MADGRSIISQGLCKDIKWLIQNSEFEFDMRVMGIDGWDMILGVDWMYQFSPISFDFKQLKISLSKDQEKIMLEGRVENPVVKRMSGKAVKKCRMEELRTKAVCNACTDATINNTIPEEFSELLTEFGDIFDNPTTLPPEKPLDHAISRKQEAQPFK